MRISKKPPALYIRTLREAVLGLGGTGSFDR